MVLKKIEKYSRLNLFGTVIQKEKFDTDFSVLVLEKANFSGLAMVTLNSVYLCSMVFCILYSKRFRYPPEEQRRTTDKRIL